MAGETVAHFEERGTELGQGGLRALQNPGKVTIDPVRSFIVFAFGWRQVDQFSTQKFNLARLVGKEFEFFEGQVGNCRGCHRNLQAQAGFSRRKRATFSVAPPNSGDWNSAENISAVPSGR